MTASERPAGRPTSSARPAGAMGGRGTGTPSTDPSIILAVLEHSDTHAFLATAARFGVSLRTVTRWRARRAEAAAAGGQWPTQVDIDYWAQQQPVREVNRSRQRSWMRRRTLAGGSLWIDAVGTVRRLQALAALGWRYSDLAEPLGVADTRVGHLTTGLSARVHRDTAAAVQALYERLCITPGPSKRTRLLAASRGWAPPLAWDDIDSPAARPHRTGDRHVAGTAFDEVAVTRAMDGERVHLRPAERSEAVRRLTARGRSAAEIAELLDTTKRAVVRHRSTDTDRRSA